MTDILFINIRFLFVLIRYLNFISILRNSKIIIQQLICFSFTFYKFYHTFVCMEKKDFKSKLFNKIISKDDPDYWSYLYGETLFRISILDEINCDCIKCYSERSALNRGLRQMHSYPIINDLKGSKNFEYKNCGRVKKKP